MSEFNPNGDVDDLDAAVREGRAWHSARKFRVLVGDENLAFKPVILTDPVPLGRQLLEAVRAHPIEEHAVVAILANGDFEDIRLDEAFDLRARGAEKVIVFRTDRSFKFKIDHRDLEWGKACISGRVLKKLADLEEGYDLYLDVRGGQGHDHLIEDCDLIKLDEPGVERFISLIAETTEGRTLLPSIDAAYLDEQSFDYEATKDGAQIGVVIKGFPLPDGLYDHAQTDVLILLPTGYPDACPDMFYTSPEIKFASTGQTPKAANVQHSFGGRVWQRWSRHCSSWRPGVDGLHTMIARASAAVESAKP